MYTDGGGPDDELNVVFSNEGSSMNSAESASQEASPRPRAKRASSRTTRHKKARSGFSFTRSKKSSKAGTRSAKKAQKEHSGELMPYGSVTVSDSSGSSAQSSFSASGSFSSNGTWYGADVRRKGQGAARRDIPYYRSAYVGDYDVELSNSSHSSQNSVQLDRRQQATGTDQLFAVLTRLCRQLLRQPVLLVLLLLVPLIFVCVIVVLWTMKGTSKYPEGTMSYERLSSNAAIGAHPVEYYPTLFCFNPDSGEAPITGLQSCSNATLCGKGSNSISSDVPFTSNAFCVQGTVPGVDSTNPYFSVLLAAAAESFGLSSPPQLDTLIAMHWAAQLDKEPLLRLTASALIGLTPNNRYTASLGGRYMLFAGANTAAITALTNYINQTYNFFHYVHGGNYASVEEAKDAHSYQDTWMIVEVSALDMSAFNMTIHAPDTMLPRFGELVNPGYSGGTSTDAADVYYASGVLTLQHLISQYYITEVLNETFDSAPYVNAMSYPKYVFVTLLGLPRAFLPLIFVLAFLFPVAVTTKRLVQEKEMRIREAVLIMGLSTWTLYVAEALIQFVTLFITCVLSTVILRVTFVIESDVMILFLIYFLFSLTLIPLSGVISAFFNKARLASLMAPVVYFIISIPLFAIPNAQGGVVIGFSFLSPSAFAAAMNIFLRHEASGGFQSYHFQAPEDSPTLAVVIGIMTADIVIYYLLMLYLDAVLPKEWGTSKHPLFFIVDPIRHCCCGKAKRLEGGSDGCDSNGVFEDLDQSRDVVVIDGLRKEYKRDGKSFVAVNNLYWGMCESEISVLLGHNGAGKTTVMNMMTGMIEPDEGDCYIYGNSVRQELSAVRQDLGFCPQHNILWPELTCRDHLEFFAQIKGLKGEALEDAVCRVLYETDMLDKIDVASGSLSGGMKRKLSIAIAFVGGSRLVFLDEPTAGLDVAARRHTWELLKRMSLSRTILLTTHYMDEADLLGRRIGIMSQGRLKCSGSGLFLKSQIGVGYSIVVAIGPETDPSVVDSILYSSVTGAVPLGRNGCELSYQLPKASAQEFPALLRGLDEEGTALGVRGYALSATTLEEVFLKVSEHDVVGRNSDMTDDDKTSLKRAWRCKIDDSRCATQFKAMMIKRFWNALRDRRMQCFQIVCPVVCILIAMLLALITAPDPASLSLSLDDYAAATDTLVQTALCGDLLGSPPSSGGVHFEETRFQTAQNLADYQLDTWFEHNYSRYLSLSCSDAQIAAMALQATSNAFTAAHVMFYNTSSKHSVAIGTAELYRQAVRHKRGDATKVSHQVALLNGKTPSDALSLLFVGFLVMVPLTFLPSNPVAWVVKERECGARHLQDMAGLNYVMYWASNFVFDFCAYLVTMLLCIAIFAIFQRDEFISSSNIGGTFALLLVYGLNTTPLAYAVSFLFNDHSSAQTTVMALSFVLGFLLLMIVYVLMTEPSTIETSDTLRWPFRIVPTYCIGEGILSLMLIDRKINVGTANGVWDLDELGYPLIYMAAEIPLFVAIVLLVDQPRIRRWFQGRGYKRERRPSVPADEDSDVEEERLAVMDANVDGDTSDAVRVVNLQKQYGSGKKAKLAVKGISFSIFPGEVFGFLGTNGAGKTTTMSMLCQYFLPSGGEATISGNDLVRDGADALQCIGFCPQFDATLDLLTVEEHLWLYTRVHGVVKEQREEVVNALIQLCELSLYRNVISSKLSGGNRRKLSVAMSLVAGPEVVFLDEPSAGMDPVARRGLWTTIQRASQRCCVVLTTHHLEEVEALADIVAIMVDGTLQCIGDKVHLKNKYGSGYEVSIRVASGEYGGALQDFMQDSFPGSILNESDDRRFVFQIPREFTFGDIFETLQQAKDALGISDYSVAQTSIEQIFLQMSERGKARS